VRQSDFELEVWLYNSRVAIFGLNTGILEFEVLESYYASQQTTLHIFIVYGYAITVSIFAIRFELVLQSLYDVLAEFSWSSLHVFQDVQVSIHDMEFVFEYFNCASNGKILRPIIVRMI